MEATKNRYAKAKFKVALANKDLATCGESANDIELQDKPVISHCWGGKISAKKGTTCYALYCPAWSSQTERVQWRNKKTGEEKTDYSYCEYQYRQDWEKTGVPQEPHKYSFAETWTVFGFGGYVVSMNKLAVQKYLVAERDANGNVIYDETGVADRAYDRWQWDMSR